MLYSACGTDDAVNTPNENSGGTVAWTCDHIEYSVKAIYEVDVERAGLTEHGLGAFRAALGCM